MSTTRGFAFCVLVGLLGLCGASAGCDGPPPITQPTSLLLTSVSPAAGPQLGATPVTIFGYGFKPGATVQFGGVPAIVSLLSPDKITATAPAHSEGAVNVVVAHPDGESSTLLGAYVYEVDTAFAIFGVITEITDQGEIPVEGVQITEIGTFRSVQTDATGAYRLDDLRRSVFDITVSAPGYVTVTKSVTSRSDMQIDLRVVRTPGFVLSGMVFESTPDGRVPLEGVVLYCDGCGSPVGHTHVRTDANGLYRFGWTLNGKNWITSVSKDGYRYAGPIEQLGIPVTVAGNTQFDIELVKR